MDAALEKLARTAGETQSGRLRASFIAGDLAKVATLYADERTRPEAEATLAHWSQSADPLRKGMAAAWMSRARQAVSPVVAAGVGAAEKAKAAAGAVKGHASAAVAPVKRAYEAGANRAGDLGAAAGEKLANSSMMAARKESATERFGQKARGRMASRMAPKGRVPGAIREVDEAAPRFEPGSAAPDAHGAALKQAYDRGRQHGAEHFTSHTAAHGRAAARFAFKAGLHLGAVGAGAAAGGAYEKSQRNQGRA